MASGARRRRRRARRGLRRALLAAERTALNFLGHLSGIATLTARYVEAVAGTGATILDTRKTTPGMRALEKAAVAAGGGTNHRMGLHDAILIKENHAAIAGGVGAAVRAARQAQPGLEIEVECRDAAEVAAALEAGPSGSVDNMDATGCGPPSRLGTPRPARAAAQRRLRHRAGSRSTPSPR